MPSRVREQAGMGLVELLIAMTVMAIGIFALVAGFSSGHVALQRASNATSAASVADERMEGYRALRYSAIPTCQPTTRPATDVCSSTLSSSAGDGRTFQVETLVGFRCPVDTQTLGSSVASPTCTGSPVARATKAVTILVRDETGTRILYRQTSTFDASTG